MIERKKKLNVSFYVKTFDFSNSLPFQNCIGTIFNSNENKNILSFSLFYIEVNTKSKQCGKGSEGRERQTKPISS